MICSIILAGVLPHLFKFFVGEGVLIGRSGRLDTEYGSPAMPITPFPRAMGAPWRPPRGLFPRLCVPLYGRFFLRWSNQSSNFGALCHGRTSGFRNWDRYQQDGQRGLSRFDLCASLTWL